MLRKINDRVLGLLALSMAACSPTSPMPPDSLPVLGPAGAGVAGAKSATAGVGAGGMGGAPAPVAGSSGGAGAPVAANPGTPGSPAPTGGAGGTGGSSPAPTYAPTFSAIYNEVFATHGCKLGGCHIGTSMKPGADAASTYANIIDIAASGKEQAGLPACGASGKKLIVPGNPNESLLLLKLKDAPPCGKRMRLNGPYLNDQEIDQITRWIQAGAPNN